MKKLLTFWLVLATLAVANGQGKIKFTEYDLPNGLHVILQEDNTTPNVIVSVMYHVGAKNENPEKTGFAHFFEHLMFEGSQNIDRGDYFKLVQANGGALNANTTQDRTYYFEKMPSNQLELALWMEAERMLHAKIDSIGIETQKGVVIEERKQSYDNRPYGTWMEKMGELAFTEHPYKWQTIGYPEHIRKSTYDDVYDFYKTFYVPNNAVLIVVGDIDEKQTKAWISKYFADIPRGEHEVYRPTAVEPAQTKEVREIVYDKVQLPALFMGYHAPAMGTKDAYALEILSNILSGGASSRLKNNIDEKGLAIQTLMLPFIQEHPGLNYILSIANVGGNIEELEKTVDAELENVRTTLVSEEEFQMAIAAKEFEVASAMGSIEDVAYELANHYTYFKDANRINKTMEFYSNLTREDLLNVAKKYLAPTNRVVLYYLPESAKK